MNKFKNLKNHGLKEEHIKQWCDALRSGKYKQTTGTLQGRQGYCCLGVACELFIPKGQKMRGPDGCLQGGMPTTSTQPNAPEWLMPLVEDCSNLMGKYLPGLNDGGSTFNQIADVLEDIFLKEEVDEQPYR